MMVRYRQEGQILPLGLALMAISMIGAYVLFNTGQVATDKMRLANAADAAAYSGMLWQARAMNFQSYSNRAMVANQVAIGQAVSLQSWVSYGAVASENVASVLKGVPVINLVSGGLQSGLNVVERVVSPVANVLLRVSDAVNRGLSVAQKAVFVSTFVATPDVVRSVVSETDTRFSINTAFSGLGLANNLNQWRQFTDGFSEDDADAMDERMQMINDSRDKFTGARNWKFFNFWFYSTFITRHQVHREGLTKLIRVETPEGVEWEWKAKDTMSLQNRVSTWKGTRRYELPIGWAEAFANSAGSARTIEPGACTTAAEMKLNKPCTRFLGKNRRAEYKADIGSRGLMGKETRTAMKGYTGVQAYRSLSLATRQEEQPTLSLKVEISLPVDSVNASHAKASGGQVSAPVSAPGNVLTSVSVGEVFYKHPSSDQPDATDSVFEPANGYSPYWTVRLGQVSNADRLLAFAMRGDVASTSVPVSGELPDTTAALATYEETPSALSAARQGGLAGALGASPTPHVVSAAGHFETVASAHASVNLDGFRDDIKDHLVDVLKEQVGQLLAGALPGSSSGGKPSMENQQASITAMADNALGDLSSADAAKPYQQVVAEATESAERLEQTFRDIRDTVVAEFRVVYEAAAEQFRQDLSFLTSEIEREKLIVQSGAGGVAKSAQKRIYALIKEIRQRKQTMREDLATELMRIVSETTDLYSMTRREALFAIDQLMQTEESEVELPWLETPDEEDADG